MSVVNKRSLRKALWIDDPSATDVGEALRDLDQRVRALTGIVDVRSYPGYLYVPPLMIATNGVTPIAVHMGAVRVPGSPTNIQPSITPLWDMHDGQVRINTISGLTVGTRYDLSVLLFFMGGS